jgi:hypothetical protein
LCCHKFRRKQLSRLTIPGLLGTHLAIFYVTIRPVSSLLLDA